MYIQKWISPTEALYKQTSRFRSLYVYEKNYIKKFTTNTQLLTKKEKLFILYQPGSKYKSLS